MNDLETKLNGLTSDLEEYQERSYKKLGELQLTWGIVDNDLLYESMIEKETELQTLGYVILKLKELTKDGRTNETVELKATLH